MFSCHENCMDRNLTLHSYVEIICSVKKDIYIVIEGKLLSHIVD